MKFFKNIHEYFPFLSLLKFIVALAIGIQVIIITYNNFSGYYVLSGFNHFLLRLLRGTLLSILAGFFLVYPDLGIIQWLNRIAPWGKKLIYRIFVQLAFSIIVAVINAISITMFANWLSPYTEDLKGVLINNALIYSVVNLILIAILEGWMYNTESSRAKQMADSLREELSQIRFEVLKSQINPHFMFNSLNVLSGLINNDVVKAQQFIDEFSHIYRYVLETIEQPVVTLGKELGFMRSYLFLQQIRYGSDLSYSVNIMAHLLKLYLPPLSLQVVLENAIKHNIVNESKPLKIEIYNEDDVLVVRNNIQPKISAPVSTGLGLKNLAKRYALICKTEPVFYVDAKYYIAKLPLIEAEQDESSDN